MIRVFRYTAKSFTFFLYNCLISINFPGTSERVCLITGSVEAVRKVHIFIMEKIREKPEPNPKLDENKSTYERHRQVKLVLLIFSYCQSILMINVYFSYHFPFVFKDICSDGICLYSL